MKGIIIFLFAILRLQLSLLVISLDINDSLIVNNDDGQETNHDHSSENLHDVLSYDVDGSKTLEILLVGVVSGTKKIFGLIAHLVRVTGDTIAGVIGGVMKTIGSFVRLFGLGLLEFSFTVSRPKSPEENMPGFHDLLMRRVAIWIHASGEIMLGFSETLILTGEALEILSSGLGQAIEDSFRALQDITSSVESGTKYLLDYSLRNRRSRSTSNNLSLPKGHDIDSNAVSTFTVHTTTATDTNNYINEWLESEQYKNNVLQSLFLPSCPKNNFSNSYDVYSNSQCRNIVTPPILASSLSSSSSSSPSATLFPSRTPTLTTTKYPPSTTGYVETNKHEEPFFRNANHPPLEPSSSPSSSSSRVFPNNSSAYDIHVEAELKQLFPEGYDATNLPASTVTWSQLLYYWLLRPFHHTLRSPAIHFHLLGCLLLIALSAIFFTSISTTTTTTSTGAGAGSSGQSWSRWLRYMAVIFVLTLSCWIYLVLLDYSQRVKIERSSRIDGISTYILQKVMEQDLKLNPLASYETSFWLNTVLSSLWLAGNNGGGLSPYLSSAIEINLNILLSQTLTLDTVRNLKVKRFDLGSRPPLVRAVRVTQRRPEICVTLERQKRRGFSNNNNSSSSSSSSRNKERDSEESYQEGGTPRVRNTKGRKDSSSSSSSSNGRGSSTTGSCMRLVLDVDFVFETEDLEVMLSLRPMDVKSVLPEASITLTGLSLGGRLRIDSEVSPDFPFLGKSLIQFLELPELEVTVSSFGLSDVSTLPGVQGWLNTTLSWVLLQYTYPNTCPIDLGPLLCPICFVPPPPTPGEVLREVLRGAGEVTGNLTRKWLNQLSTIQENIVMPAIQQLVDLFTQDMRLEECLEIHLQEQKQKDIDTTTNKDHYPDPIYQTSGKRRGGNSPGDSPFVNRDRRFSSSHSTNSNSKWETPRRITLAPCSSSTAPSHCGRGKDELIRLCRLAEQPLADVVAIGLTSVERQWCWAYRESVLDVTRRSSSSSSSSNRDKDTSYLRHRLMSWKRMILTSTRLRKVATIIYHDIAVISVRVIHNISQIMSHYFSILKNNLLIEVEEGLVWFYQ